jgi:hypothetical protein
MDKVVQGLLLWMGLTLITYFVAKLIFGKKAIKKSFLAQCLIYGIPLIIAIKITLPNYILTIGDLGSMFLGILIWLVIIGVIVSVFHSLTGL